MLKPKMSDEAKFLLVIIILILSVPVAFYLLGRLQPPEPKPAEAPKDRKKELTVLVSESTQKNTAPLITSKAAVDKIRGSIKQGSYSTAHLMLQTVPRQAPEYRELLNEIMAANQGKTGPRRIPATEKTPLRYVDASSPRERTADAVYLYIIDEQGSPSPWFCVQSYGSRLGISDLRFKADGKTLTLHSPPVVAEKHGANYSEYYDAPLNRESFAVVKRVATALDAEVVYVGGTRVRKRPVTDQERRAMIRILELYEALGGSFAPFESR